MFLLVSGRHVGAHPDGHQHGVSIQITLNLGDTLLRIAREVKTAETWFLAVEAVFIAIIFYIPDSWMYLLNGYDFSFDHMTDENREFDE